MTNDLMRFSVAMPEELLVRFDQLVARRGLAKNRSEVVRDLVRDALIEDECALPGVMVKHNSKRPAGEVTPDPARLRGQHRFVHACARGRASVP